MGSSAAYHLAARGQSGCSGWRSSAAHDRGSSHGGSRVIRQSYFEDPAYVPLLLRAYELWEKLAQDTGREVYQLTGGDGSGSRQPHRRRQPCAAPRSGSLRVRDLDAVELRRRFPTINPSRGTGAIRVQGRLARLEETVAAHIDVAAAGGRRPALGEAMISGEGRPTASRWRPGKGSYTAGQLVLAPGAGPRCCWPTWVCRSPSNARSSTGSSPPAGSRPTCRREPSDLHLGGRGRQPGLRLPGDRRAGRRRSPSSGAAS